MRFPTLPTAVMSSVAALVGFAGGAHASATVDLIWIDKTDSACTDAARRDCPRLGTAISSVAISDDIVLAVILTAGPGGVVGAGVSVNYGDALPSLGVIDYGSLGTAPFLPAHVGTTTNQPPYIDNINAGAIFATNSGIGLPAGQSAYLGTVSFHKELIQLGIFEISAGTDGPGGTDGVVRLSDSAPISSTTTFNSAYLIQAFVDPAPCNDLVIEVNSLRTSGRKVKAGPNQTVNVTAKARILKGTAVPGTTIDTTLAIRAQDGATVIGSNSTAPGAIQLEIGKGGNGATLPVDVPQCTAGHIDFFAKFFGFDADGDLCEGAKTLRRECI